MVAPDVEIDNGKGTILISSEEGETEGIHSTLYKDVDRSHPPTPDNLPHRLAEFGVGDGCRLKCDDFLQNFELTVIILHR